MTSRGRVSRPDWSMSSRGMTVLELTVALALVALLSTVVGVGTSVYVSRTSDADAQASLDAVMAAQWRRVAATGAFTEDPSKLDVIADKTFTQQPSNDPDTVSMVVVGDSLRLAVRSKSGRCFGRFYEDPLEESRATETEIEGACSALEVPEPS